MPLAATLKLFDLKVLLRNFTTLPFLNDDIKSVGPFQGSHNHHYHCHHHLHSHHQCIITIVLLLLSSSFIFCLSSPPPFPPVLHFLLFSTSFSFFSFSFFPSAFSSSYFFFFFSFSRVVIVILHLCDSLVLIDTTCLIVFHQALPRDWCNSVRGPDWVIQQESCAEDQCVHHITPTPAPGGRPGWLH